ncbi:DUF4238 domain-containing protein [Rhizobium sp. C4]|uniref:DUF4238 domain-containing protein n=1 Tax=Rhizobium sp. C4 TaxID=1349800 RepID=UPI001E5A6218|nr:DUF4238 domain-containing protein [Rhizobium sp. C4]MCD2175073.1 DUF4238 domain-containing protein [Rhizobium sp. C4]
MDNTKQQPLYHHYLPSFYQARWAGEDGKLRRFSKPIENKIVAKWVSPEVSGGEDLLYTDHAAPVDIAQALESGFMSPLDSLASQALVALEANDPILRRDSRLRSAWSRFLMSLMMRMPDHLETLSGGLMEEWARAMPELEAAYAVGKGPTDPATLTEYLDGRSPHEIRSWMFRVLRTLIDHSQVGALINNMRWFVREIDGPAQFLTSDRPIITLYEFAAEDSYIILPIGPKSAFVAVNNVATQRRIEAYDAERWVGGLNRLIAGAAVRFAFARDDEMRPLIEKAFGSKPRTTLFQYLVRYQRQKNPD